MLRGAATVGFDAGEDRQEDAHMKVLLVANQTLGGAELAAHLGE